MVNCGDFVVPGGAVFCFEKNARFVNYFSSWKVTQIVFRGYGRLMRTDLAALFSGEGFVEISTECEPFHSHNRRAGTIKIASCIQFEPR